jgi:hypothetical protein
MIGLVRGIMGLELLRDIPEDGCDGRAQVREIPAAGEEFKKSLAVL